RLEDDDHTAVEEADRGLHHRAVRVESSRPARRPRALPASEDAGRTMKPVRQPPRAVRVSLLVLAAALAAAVQGAEHRTGPSAVGLAGPRPRLVVLISIDQFRGDYLTRFADLWLPAGGRGAGVHGTLGDPGDPGSTAIAGFRYFMERGAYFTDAHH